MCNAFFHCTQYSGFTRYSGQNAADQTIHYIESRLLYLQYIIRALDEQDVVLRAHMVRDDGFHLGHVGLFDLGVESLPLAAAASAIATFYYTGEMCMSM